MHLLAITHHRKFSKEHNQQLRNLLARRLHQRRARNEMSHERAVHQFVPTVYRVRAAVVSATSTPSA